MVMVGVVHSIPFTCAGFMREGMDYDTPSCQASCVLFNMWSNSITDMLEQQCQYSYLSLPTYPLPHPSHPSPCLLPMPPPHASSPCLLSMPPPHASPPHFPPPHASSLSLNPPHHLVAVGAVNWFSEVLLHKLVSLHHLHVLFLDVYSPTPPSPCCGILG